MLLEKLSLVRQPLKEKRHRDHVFCSSCVGRGNQRRRDARKKDPPRSGSLRVFYCCFSLADDHRSFFPLPSWFISAVRVRRYPVLFRRRCRAYAFQRHRYNSLQRCRRRDTRSVFGYYIYYTRTFTLLVKLNRGIPPFHCRGWRNSFLGINPIISLYIWSVYIETLIVRCRDKIWNIF